MLSLIPRYKSIFTVSFTVNKLFDLRENVYDGKAYEPIPYKSSQCWSIQARL